MSFGMTTHEVRAAADAELARQYAMARELRGEPQGEWVPVQTALMDQPAYWTPERIHRLRTWLRDSPAEFAARLGVGRKTVDNWERKAFNVGTVTAERMADLARDMGWEA